MVSRAHRFFVKPFFRRLRAFIPSEYMVAIAFIVTLAAFIVMFFTFTSVGFREKKFGTPQSLPADYLHVEGLIFRNNLVAVRISFKHSAKIESINVSVWYRNGVMLIDNIYPKNSLQFIGKIGDSEYLFCYQCCERLSSYEGFIPTIGNNVSLTVFNSSSGNIIVSIGMPLENRFDKKLYTCNDFVKSAFLSEKNGLILLAYAASNVFVVYLKSSGSEEYYIIFPQRYGKLKLELSTVIIQLFKDNKQYAISFTPSFPRNMPDFEWIEFQYKTR